MYERVRLGGTNVYTIFRNRLELLIRGGGCMPIKLHIDPARPLNDGIASNRIIKRADYDVSTICLSCADSRVHVGYQVAGTFETERIGDRRFEAKHR